MRKALIIFFCITTWRLAEGLSCPAATVLFSPFDSLAGWSVRSVGASEAGIVHRPNSMQAVELTSRGGTVFLTRELPLADVAGCRLTVNCLVESDAIVPGVQLSSTGKVHLAVESPEGLAHYSARFSGTSPLHREGFSADVPADARRVVLNLGLEACSGTARFGRLVVENDKRGIHPLDLSQTANAGHDQLGIEAFPSGTVEWEGIPFRIMNADDHDGSDCFRLRGIGHDDWPANTASPIPAGTCASAIYILHGALGGRETSETPSAIWSASFAGGQDNGLSLFEGREIGAIGRTEDAENWQVAWQSEAADGRPVTFGVTKWVVYSDAPLVGLSCRAYNGAPPVVLAITVVEEPPAPPQEEGQFDEMGEGFSEGE
jgi:hypothetical protein